MKSRRSYTMVARAASTDATRRRILDALIALAGERPFTEITLEVIADRAEVSVQTILRRFGSREGLFGQTLEAAIADVTEERRTPPGDVGAAVRIVVDHYEQRGRFALLMLDQESHDPTARTVTDRGRRLHREWVREAFGTLTDVPATLELLAVVTDVYVWKLLRLDRRHSRATTQRRMQELVEGVLESGG